MMEPTYGDEMEPAAFKYACEGYAEWAVSHYDTFDGVDLSDVSIEVSQKMKRAAGKAGNKRGEYFMRFAYGAYQKWGWGDKIEGVIVHELIHILQYQQRGDGGHGLFFKRKANEVGAPRHCENFTEYNYEILCEECDKVVAGRYQRSKLVKQAERYRSKCCDAPCRSEKVQ